MRPDPDDSDLEGEEPTDVDSDSDLDVIGESTGVNVNQTESSNAFTRPSTFAEDMRRGEISIDPVLALACQRAYKLGYFRQSRDYGGIARETRTPLKELETADALPVMVRIEGDEMVTRFAQEGGS